MDSESNIFITRGKLAKSLGPNYDRYVLLMKKWFTKEITKEEYDEELRTFLTPVQIRFHNKFILSMLSKCSSTASSTSPFLFTDSDVEPDFKKIKLEDVEATFNNLMQIDYHDHVKEVKPKTLHEELVSKGFLNFLPDYDTIHARMMLHAWEHDLNDVEENACRLIIEATYTFARNVLTAIISRRSGFKTKDREFVYGHGSPIANPWLRNAMKYESNDRCEATEIVNHDECVHVPKIKPMLSEMEEKIAFELALSSENTQAIRRSPVNIDDVINALKVHPNVIPRYLMYSVNMEKLLLSRNHLSWEDIANGK
ncbi:transcriptional adapter 1-like [Planococcus citri]|uniref:transcriptional adapter 1-like n=1 Tax=Planococcus citri TaxID=170843 RepID=UPI0031F9BB9F